MAEYRELIRIPNGVLTGRLKSFYPDAPTEYTLGSGHIKFFVSRIPYLFYRHSELYKELLYRNFNITFMDWSKTFDSLPDDCRNLYMPTPAEISLNISRIIDRMPANPRFTNRPIPDYWINHSLKGA